MAKLLLLSFTSLLMMLSLCAPLVVMSKQVLSRQKSSQIVANRNAAANNNNHGRNQHHHQRALPEPNWRLAEAQHQARMEALGEAVAEFAGLDRQLARTDQGRHPLTWNRLFAQYERLNDRMHRLQLELYRADMAHYWEMKQWAESTGRWEQARHWEAMYQAAEREEQLLLNEHEQLQ